MLRGLSFSLLWLCCLDSPAIAHAQSGKAPQGKSVKSDDAAASKFAKLLDDYFSICDLDDSTWISFREASATMGISKSEFRDLDDDNDGRFTRIEFGKHSERALKLLGAIPGAPSTTVSQAPAAQVKSGEASAQSQQRTTQSESSGNPFADALRSVGSQSTGNLDLHQLLSSAPGRSPLAGSEPAVAPPVSKPRLPAIPYPSPLEMLALFDHDKSGGLSRREVKSVLARVHAKLSADVIVDRTDRNENGELEPLELGPLSFIVSRRLPADGILNLQGPGATGASLLGWAPNKSNLAKPMNGLTVAEHFSHFSLLDSDGNGRIDSADLRLKLSQSHSSVRASAIISALDENGDGSVDPEEFMVAVRGRN